MKTRVLVTGGAGLIGSNLVKHLVTHGDVEVHVVDNLWRGKIEYLNNELDEPIIPIDSNFFDMDLRDFDGSKHIFRGIDEVYHLADTVAGIHYVFGHQTEIFRDNVLINTNVLKAAMEAEVKKFLYVGTACSYPQKMQFGADAPPLKENDVYPADPESAYGWSKLMGEYETLLYGQETDMETGVLRLHNVYGSPCDYSPERSQVIPSLIRKAILHPKEEFVVWGTGDQGRSFIHVDDVVRGLVLMMEKGLGREPVQIGTDYCSSIREIAEKVVEISGKNIDIRYDSSKPEGDKGRCADCSRALRKINWRPEVSLEEGLTQIYYWIDADLKKHSIR